ncbi:hypothetical protein [Paenibacillus montaniterrae]|uniref:hypothetical protein n=1 Tax=Paenibacillus montaniterrae TaxID=429341 RepID=UPI001FE8AE28|nr:hypothetical protein [Paenibacillus montaniterrae]
MLAELVKEYPAGSNIVSITHRGFLWGIWHGWVAPISLIIGVFNENIRLYETYNSGWWYDLGFYIAVISGFGGISFFRRKKNSRD